MLGIKTMEQNCQLVFKPETPILYCLQSSEWLKLLGEENTKKQNKKKLKIFKNPIFLIMTTKNQHKNTPMNKDAAHALQQKRHSVSTHWKKYNSHHHLGKNFTTKIIFWFVPFHTSVTTLTSNYKEKTLATKTQQTSNSWQWCTSGRETPVPFRRPKKQTKHLPTKKTNRKQSAWNCRVRDSKYVSHSSRQINFVHRMNALQCPLEMKVWIKCL